MLVVICGTLLHGKGKGKGRTGMLSRVARAKAKQLVEETKITAELNLTKQS